MLAQLHGSGLSFRQTSLAILTSFAITAAVLGALSPVSFFILYNTPPLNSRTAVMGHSLTLLSHVCLIACAGSSPIDGSFACSREPAENFGRHAPSSGVG